jgi:ketosteroid isomerase-like protein
MKKLLIFYAITALAFAQQRPPTKASQADEMAIRTVDEAWAGAIGKKSIEETVSFYDPEAVTAGSAMPPAKGIAAIRAMWTQLFADPGFALTWKVDKVVITESQTIGYSSGTWNIGTSSGPYFAVWRKQPDGKWKVLMDAAWYGQKS